MNEWPDINECTMYTNHLFDLLRESRKRSLPALAFVSRTAARADCMMADEAKIKEKISSYITEENLEGLATLLLEIERVVRLISPERILDRPVYVKLITLVV